MSDESKLMELMCIKCGGELTTGIFIPAKGGFIPDALMCKICEWVWEKP